MGLLCPTPWVLNFVSRHQANEQLSVLLSYRMPSQVHIENAPATLFRFTQFNICSCSLQRHRNDQNSSRCPLNYDHWLHSFQRTKHRNGLRLCLQRQRVSWTDCHLPSIKTSTKDKKVVSNTLPLPSKHQTKIKSSFLALNYLLSTSNGFAALMTFILTFINFS